MLHPYTVESVVFIDTFDLCLSTQNAAIEYENVIITKWLPFLNIFLKQETTL